MLTKLCGMKKVPLSLGRLVSRSVSRSVGSSRVGVREGGEEGHNSRVTLASLLEGKTKVLMLGPVE